ncbi:MAG: phosphotransferase family protein [Streptococcaceae bacterium]|jgi:thiamine kinase-like enzyme|nr:phosphotransferase family protein [Streptococcaceae bacterium]
MANEALKLNGEMRPIESSSGTSYMGKIGTQQVFVKLNASPILPLVAAEGITPKILWTRELENGNGSLTAQSWIEGHVLTNAEMLHPDIPKLLMKLHTSRSIRDSLSQFDRSVKRPASVLNDLLENEESQIAKNSFLSGVAQEMQTKVPMLNNLNIMVLHGDIRPSNWLLEEKTGRLYLIDWDTVSLGDPFYDIGYYISHFVARADWAMMMSRLGYSLTDVSVWSKLRWYGQLAFLVHADHAMRLNNIVAANREIQGLRLFMGQF